MSILNNFIEHYDNAYQTVWNKVLVSKEVANTRFQNTLRYGESIARVKYDLSNVLVRDTVRHTDSVIDTLSDTEELLTVDIEKEIAFRLSDGEVTQAGPLAPMETIGRQAAIKLATDLDHRVFSKVPLASQTFDAGDLTTLASNGTPITLNATTVPQMASRLPAKLMRTENQTVTNLIGVWDAYAAADITQYLMGKDIDLAGSAFKNGFAGTLVSMAGSSVYVSENLLGEVRLVVDVATADEVVTINGVTFTAKVAPANPGEFDIAGSADAQGAIMANMINGAATGKDSASGYFEVSAANRAILQNANVRAEYNDATDTLHIYSAGRSIFATTMSGATTNRLHCYFGKRGGIDLVTQDMSKVDIRQESRQRASIIYSSYLAAIGVFDDSKRTFMDVQIAA
jgi:hypothetical protein